jgi:hypothetical protein
MRLPHWVSGGARPDRKWGDMGAKSPGTSKRERCGSSLPINRYFFAFFPRRCDRPNKRSDGASWGSETPIADVIDANDDFRFVPRADLHRLACPVLENTECVCSGGWLGWPRPTGDQSNLEAGRLIHVGSNPRLEATYTEHSAITSDNRENRSKSRTRNHLNLQLRLLTTVAIARRRDPAQGMSVFEV